MPGLVPRGREMPFRGPPRDLPPWVPGIGPGWSAGSDAIRTTLKRSKAVRVLDPGRRLKLPFERLTLETSDGARLAAWFVPGTSAAPPGAAVVLHHHYGGQKATVLPWIAWLHERGWPCIAFDGRGHAESPETPEGRGSFVARRADVHAACEELRRRGFDRIVALGQSQGAAALVMAAAWRRDVVAVVLDSGPAPEMLCAAWGLAGNMLGRTARLHPGWRALLALRILPGTQPARYLLGLWASLARLRDRPLLWLHGGRDEVIPRPWSGLWFGALSTPRWEALAVPEAEHVRTLAVGGAPVEAAVERFLSGLG